MSHDKHWNLGSVLTLIPDLGRDEILRQKALDFSTPQLPPLLSFLQGIVKTILGKDRRVGEARESGEEQRVLSIARDCDLSDEIWSDPSNAFAILEVVDVDLVVDLLQLINLSAFLPTRGKAHGHLSCTQ